MRCYTRFWKPEPFSANNRRVWTWVFLMVVIGLSMVYMALTRDTRADVDGSLADSKSATADPPLVLKSSARDPMREAARKAAQEDELLLARIQEETVAQENINRFEKFEETLAADRSEFESLTKVEVSYLIEQWRKAWEAGMVDIYLAYYSDRFVPANSMTREAWSSTRRDRVRPDKQIQLNLSNFDVVFDDRFENSTVEFDQEYRSGSYYEKSRKQLVLSKEDQAWKILTEIELNPN